MNILPINNNQTSFNARLFTPKGEQLKAFQLTDIFNGVDLMSSKGSKATDIFIKSFESKPFAGVFENFAKVTVKNPLFGSQDIVQDLVHKTNTPKTREMDWTSNAERLTGSLTKDCELLEDKALEKFIIDEIKERRKTFELYSDDSSILSPKHILDEKLSAVNPEEHGFSEERIAEFRKQANLLESQILYWGIKSM